MSFLRPLFAALVLLAARPAATTVIHVETTTQLTLAVVGNYASLFTVGETVHIRYAYDDAVADSNMAVGSGTFNGAVVSLSAEFPGSGLAFFFEGGAVNSLTTTDNNGFTDSFALGATGFLGGSLLDGATPASMSVSLATTVAPGPPALVVNERPAPPPFSYLSGNLAIGTATGSVSMFLAGGSGVASVPEAGAAALLGGALPGAVLVRGGRRRR